MFCYIKSISTVVLVPNPPTNLLTCFTDTIAVGNRDALKMCIEIEMYANPLGQVSLIESKHKPRAVVASMISDLVCGDKKPRGSWNGHDSNRIKQCKKATKFKCEMIYAFGKSQAIGQFWSPSCIQNCKNHVPVLALLSLFSIICRNLGMTLTSLAFVLCIAACTYLLKSLHGLSKWWRAWFDRAYYARSQRTWVDSACLATCIWMPQWRWSDDSWGWRTCAVFSRIWVGVSQELMSSIPMARDTDFSLEQIWWREVSAGWSNIRFMSYDPQKCVSSSHKNLDPCETGCADIDVKPCCMLHGKSWILEVLWHSLFYSNLLTGCTHMGL